MLLCAHNQCLLLTYHDVPVASVCFSLVHPATHGTGKSHFYLIDHNRACDFNHTFSNWVNKFGAPYGK